jgi:predicted nucleic-acid-binding Zn-ribbon protein
MEEKKTKYQCLKCGGTEFFTRGLGSKYYESKGENLVLKEIEVESDTPYELHCDNCGERLTFKLEDVLEKKDATKN